MDAPTLRSNMLLMLTATIWGVAFVAQRIGMEHVGPFTFNAVRFALGGLSLLPVMILAGRPHHDIVHPAPRSGSKILLTGGVLAGAALFAGASLQQVGIIYTTAGKAGFITGLYVVLVPIVGLAWRQRTDAGTWLGALLAATGLYFLSVTEHFTISFGDFLILLGALVWACHVLLIGWFSPKISALRLSFIQFMVCSGLSFAAAAATETITVTGLKGAAPAILYGGLGSVGIAYTLQVVAQKHARPSHAAIILCMESPFAALGGWLILDEMMTGRALAGCGLMLFGMIVSQLYPQVFPSGKARQARP
ncbi:DMT family transporter [Desulfococcus sp.]|uniref:DMT family transporter n=1 Tax=Desulfococcus sp. TaxID=2025834 RepID=UPI0035947885